MAPQLRAVAPHHCRCQACHVPRLLLLLQEEGCMAKGVPEKCSAGGGHA